MYMYTMWSREVHTCFQILEYMMIFTSGSQWFNNEMICENSTFKKKNCCEYENVQFYGSVMAVLMVAL